MQQDDDTSRYRLSLKMLDLSVRLLGRSELRLHAYPAMREVVLRTGWRAFLATAADGEVTYVWSAGPDDVAMHTTYGRAMPGHCALYFSAESARRLSCLRLESRGAVAVAPIEPRRLGPPRPTAGGAERAGQHLACTCAPVIDYAGREVARVGLFAHDLADDTLDARLPRRSRRAGAPHLAAARRHAGAAGRPRPLFPRRPDLRSIGMAYVITEKCIGTKDSACVDVCPVDCIHPRKDEPEFATVEQLYIHPDECIDCGACVPACPVEAIFAMDEVPDASKDYIDINSKYYNK